MTEIENLIVNQACKQERNTYFIPLISKQKLVNSPFGIGFIEGACWMNGNKNWISVSNRLPDVGIDVIVITTNNRQCISAMYMPKDCYGNVLGDKEWKGSSSFKNSITHWMYLPCPPSK